MQRAYSFKNRPYRTSKSGFIVNFGGLSISLDSVSKATPSKTAGLNADKVRVAVLEALRKQGDMVKKSLSRTTDTWEHARPNWKVSLHYKSAGSAYSVVSADPSSDYGAMKWYYLDRGTWERYALMGKSFKPKTKVGWVGSQTGNNSAPEIIGRQAFAERDWGPMKGIEGRGWTNMIVAGLHSSFESTVQTAISKALGITRGTISKADEKYLDILAKRTVYDSPIERKVPSENDDNEKAPRKKRRMPLPYVS